MNLYGITLALLTASAGPASGPADYHLTSDARAHAAQQCSDLPSADWLDFWVGEWVVTVGDQQVGRSHIEPILSGCAILEHWEDARGSQGKSMFYLGTGGTWQQLWVTSRSQSPGGLKEKRLLARYPDGGVRFQGEVVTPQGILLDRTTLTPLPDGTVRQLIETSRDGGETWSVGFNAVYRSRDAGSGVS